MFVFSGKDAGKHPQKLEDAFRLRHEVFVEEKGWHELGNSRRRETDQFDTDDAVHMLLYQDGALVGYQRMLPTTKPNLLSEIYPELCIGAQPCSPNIWEWTRFAVRKDYRTAGRKLSPTGNRMLSGIVEWGLENDIDSITIEMNPLWLLRLAQMRFMVRPLGHIHRYSGEDTIAVIATFDFDTLTELRALRGDSEPILPNFSKEYA